MLHCLHHPIHYDGARRRLWILGQRCHHGAAGALIAAAALGLARPARAQLRAIAVAGLGSALMLHDWKDHAVWFEPGPGNQP